MTWRFADLPVRTKFLITLGIPVVGLVLMIGKQVDGSLKRRDVLGYISSRARTIELMSGALDQLQRENALAVGYLCGIPVNAPRLDLQFTRTNEALRALGDPDIGPEQGILTANTFAGMEVLRQRISERRTTPAEAEQNYRRMKTQTLEDLGKVAKLALDPDTKDKLYSHLSLLHAKDALSNIRSLLTRAFSASGMSAEDMGILNEQVGQYETNMLLFERDAPADVMETYRAAFQGPDVNFLRTIISSVREKRSLAGPHIEPERWWELARQAMDKLKEVEDGSIHGIIAAAYANLREAEVRLAMVLLALLGVVGAVAIMAFVIMRGIRDTVNEVSTAALALSKGDISAEVPVRSNDEIGAMARIFNGMIDNIGSLAASADAIGKGNYDTTVTVRSEQDVLGNALTRMKENLKAARLRDVEQNAALQQEKEKLEQANQRIQTLMKETHHRVKNNLQVVASLLRLQSAGFEDEHLRHALEQSQNRVSSMALIHEKLYKGDDLAKLDAARYLEELFAELVRVNDVRDTIRYRTRIDEGLSFDLDTMVPLGLILNELITNSFKHAFAGRPDGNIDLTLTHVKGNEHDLVYQDDGTGIPVEKLQGGNGTLGVSLIESLVEQLNGRMTVHSDGHGTQYHIRFSTRAGARS